MHYKIKEQEKDIFQLIGEAGASLQYPTYVIGGYVRDSIIGRATKDIDVVCVGSGIALAQKVASKMFPKPKVAIYKNFGTASIHGNGYEIEFVGARKESYQRDSRKPIVEDGSLEDDQNRRDFTINALAISLNPDDYLSIVDPFGGLDDIEKKRIITPLDPATTFSDDPLRMLRAIRFATQLNYTIELETLEAISTMADRIKIISQERIISEIEKILSSEKPSIGFKLLFDTGLLQIIFPELYNLHGVEIINGIGHKDNFYHTIEVVDNIAKNTNNLWLRWAAIFHDIAKPHTKAFDEKAGWTFHGHENLGAALLPKIFHKMKLATDHRLKYVQKLVKLHLRPISLTKENITDTAIRRLLFEAGDDIDDLMILCEADITSKNSKKVERYLSNYELVRDKLKEIEEKDAIRNWQPPVSGEEIMEMYGLSPSREVGILKNSIREAILDGIIGNNRQEALELLSKEAEKIGLVKQ